MALPLYAVQSAVAERLTEVTEPMTTRELANALSLKLGVEASTLSHPLIKIAPTCGMARRLPPEERQMYGKIMTIRPWLWLPKADWTAQPKTPESPTSGPGTSLVERVTDLEAQVAELRSLIQLAL